MSKLTSEFQYKYEIESGETAWNKVIVYKTLLSELKYQSDVAGENVKFIQDKIEGLKYGKTMTSETRGKASIDIDLSKAAIDLANAQEEWAILKKNVTSCRNVMQEFKDIADANKIVGKTDDEMYAQNALNEYAQVLAKDLQAEIISLGKPRVETIKRAMINATVWAAMKAAGLIQSDAAMIAVNQDATKIEIIKMQ
jgi:hypothetical protein